LKESNAIVRIYRRPFFPFVPLLASFSDSDPHLTIEAELVVYSRLGILVAQLVGQVLWYQEINSRFHFKLMGVNNGPKSRAVPGRILAS
jgi:hypothetical protein